MRRDRKMWWNCTGRNRPEGIFCSVPTARSVHCQYRELFIAPMPTENNNILGLKCLLHHWKQIPTVFTLLLPTAVCSEKKAADTAVNAVGNLFQIANSRDGVATLKGSQASHSRGKKSPRLTLKGTQHENFFGSDFRIFTFS